MIFRICDKYHSVMGCPTYTFDNFLLKGNKYNLRVFLETISIFRVVLWFQGDDIITCCSMFMYITGDRQAVVVEEISFRMQAGL